jgi:hypothetical protein
MFRLRGKHKVGGEKNVDEDCKVDGGKNFDLSLMRQKKSKVTSSSDFNNALEWFKIPLILKKVVSSLQITCPRMLVSI